MYAGVKRFLSVLIVCLGVASFVSPAAAGLVDTHEVVANAEAQQARERVKELTQRADLADELRALGVDPQQAQERVDAMTDEEVLALAGELDTVLAGAGVSNNTLILILLVVILIIAL